MGQDTSEFHAKLDFIFLHHGTTVGIGDGGNEIGMGNLAEHIPSVEQLPDEPCVTTVSHLIIASVSNWGGYGLVAGLSLLTGRNLLPSPEQEEDVIRAMVDRGAVDGVASAQVYAGGRLHAAGEPPDAGGAAPAACRARRGGVGAAAERHASGPRRPSPGPFCNRSAGAVTHFSYNS